MFHAAISCPLFTGEASASSTTKLQEVVASANLVYPPCKREPMKIKKKRSPPGNPDPEAEVVALSPRTLLTTNRFICEICNKGFQRDQNLQLHRRGHNLPWSLKQRSGGDARKKAYICPEPSCVHHHPSRALGDLTGIKKHYSRKHGEKKWKCDKCSKIYAVQSDWKAHSKACGSREYRCYCGILFSRKDSFITHRAFCDALAEESARLSAASVMQCGINGLFGPSEPRIQMGLEGCKVHVMPPSPLMVDTSAVVTHRVSSYDGALQSGNMKGRAEDVHVAGEFGHFAAWKRNECGLTRDFMGLTSVDGQEIINLGQIQRSCIGFGGSIHQPSEQWGS